ncbi:MAG TPA: acyl carrier protein [Rhizomicrobium sp.]|jgi:acyl carrier protein|nr:acyl carrier protein [Rhizomicrobium sp.]
MERDEILIRIREYMVGLFDTPPSAVTLDADLVDDLDLDSIDAIDLIVKLQELTGKKIKADEFKSVRKMHDVVDRIFEMTNAPAP